MSPINSVLPQQDYRLEVLLDNGSSITLNLASRLSNVRFSLLADQDFFGRVSTDGNYIRWEDKIEISINEVFQLAQK